MLLIAVSYTGDVGGTCGQSWTPWSTHYLLTRPIWKCAITSVHTFSSLRVLKPFTRWRHVDGFQSHKHGVTTSARTVWNANKIDLQKKKSWKMPQQSTRHTINYWGYDHTALYKLHYYHYYYYYEICRSIVSGDIRPSVLSHSWLAERKGIQPVKTQQSSKIVILEAYIHLYSQLVQ